MRSIVGLLVGAISLASIARADDFARQADLSPLGMAAVQNNQTMKTLDTFARQAVWQITGHERIDGHDSLYTMLDMSFHPDEYVTRNIIKIVNVPLREEFENLQSIDQAEKERIVKEGTVSLAFMERPEVQALLAQVDASSVAKHKAIEQVMAAMGSMGEICQVQHGFIAAEIIPPAPRGGDGHWHLPTQVIGDVPELVDVLKQHGTMPPPAAGGYEDKQAVLGNIFAATGSMLRGWDAHDASLVNQSVKDLANLLVQVNPDVYPSHAKRQTEVFYNRMTKLTIPGAIFYFVAFVLFLMTAQAGVIKLRPWAIAFMFVALLIHTTGIAIRWWLVGGIFPPIKNEFESVMCSAWFGAVVGLGLEIRKSRGFFGAAACFVGMMALVAIFAAPYVTDKQIGGEISQVQGILMSYWLYIHVTMVTASYSMIGMAFLLSTWWLVKYYTTPVALRTVSPGSPLATLDMCNLVVLQLAFWMLGAGVILGAIWADQSWGRPWGWDPKETFALVTWIVYLIAVHVRVVTINKAWWTALLGFVGFWIMLFNWVGVNFMLVGLHSYA
jgi:cytochrome c-type biogenesis protein CcsB